MVKAEPFGRSIAGIAGSNPAVVWMSVFCDCGVLSGWGPFMGLITRPEESYRVWSRIYNKNLQPLDQVSSKFCTEYLDNGMFFGITVLMCVCVGWVG